MLNPRAVFTQATSSHADTKPVPVVSVVPVVPVVSAQSKSQSAFVQTPRAEPISFAEARLREMLSPLNCRF